MTYRKHIAGRYFLHIRPDGREEIFATAPADKPTLAIEVIELKSGERFEQICTAIIPPGTGWRIHGRGSLGDDTKTWRRELAGRSVARRY